MFCIENNKKNKSAVILSPEAGVKISGASVEPVINDGAKTKRYSAKRDLYGDFAYAQPLKMTMISCFALFFSLINISESWADEVIPTSGTCNSDGTCLWSIDTAGTLTISAQDGAEDVKMADYSCNGNPCNPSTLVARPWEANLKQIKSVVIGDNITKIGQDAFQNASNLKSVTGMNDVEHIRRSAFSYSGLKSIIIPESIKNFEDQVFASNTNFTEIIIPDSLNDESITLSNALFRRSCFTSSYASTNSSCADTQIVCQGDVEKCKTVLEKFGGKGKCTLNASSECINPEIIVAAGYQQCSGNYFWNGAKCEREPDLSKRKCCNSCKDMGGWCNRIRYTPAEAAQVLKNDNTNEVTITFKK